MKNFNEKSTMYKLMFVLAMIFVATFNPNRSLGFLCVVRQREIL